MEFVNSLHIWWWFCTIFRQYLGDGTFALKVFNIVYCWLLIDFSVINIFDDFTASPSHYELCCEISPGWTAVVETTSWQFNLYHQYCPQSCWKRLHWRWLQVGMSNSIISLSSLSPSSLLSSLSSPVSSWLSLLWPWFFIYDHDCHFYHHFYHPHHNNYHFIIMTIVCIILIIIFIVMIIICIMWIILRFMIIWS